jgi:hypothetical protein
MRIGTEELVAFDQRVVSAKKNVDWLDGLGLECPTERVERLWHKATLKFQEHREAGYSFHEACDKALGLGKDLRGELSHVIREGLTAPTSTNL